MSVGDYIRSSQVWKSIFRHPAPRDRRKWARQAARSILPNACETKIFVTGNSRAWLWICTVLWFLPWYSLLPAAVGGS